MQVHRPRMKSTFKYACFHGYSARIGRQEDDEEARKEAMEQKRKVKVLKKAKSGPKQRKLTF